MAGSVGCEHSGIYRGLIQVAECFAFQGLVETLNILPAADAAAFREIQSTGYIRYSAVATRDFHGLAPLAIPHFDFAADGHRGLSRHDLRALFHCVDGDMSCF